jgi:hypothetical protein
VTPTLGVSLALELLAAQANNDLVAASQLRRDYNQWHTSQGAVHAMLDPMEWREYV